MSDYHPETLMQAGRGPRGDIDVKRWLRGRSDEECFDFIRRCVCFRGYGYEKRALDLAILRTGLAHPDASSIKFWLAFAIRKLGARKVVAELAALLDTNPSALDMALYWLPGLLPPAENASRAACQALYGEAHRRGIVRGPVPPSTADGGTLEHDL